MHASIVRRLHCCKHSIMASRTIEIPSKWAPLGCFLFSFIWWNFRLVALFASIGWNVQRMVVDSNEEGVGPPPSEFSEIVLHGAVTSSAVQSPHP
mmetsp:Transcript_11163/g.32259  ORF Transcript_11163/g.32259 Transcript_11163/m.32259 type:complete len:95 (-) Transcript_11163:263-547(-)